MAKKQANESIYLSAEFLADTEPAIIPVSATLDVILDGGVREGAIVVLSGPPGLGKTSYALAIGRNAQKVGRVVVYDSIEERLVGSLLKSVKGLDYSEKNFKYIASKEGSILSAEDHLSRMEQSVIDYPRSVIIADSLSDLSTSDEQTKELGQGFNVSARKLESEFMRRIAPKVRVNNCILIAIAHTAHSIGGYGGTNDKLAEQTKFKAGIILRCSKPAKDHEIMSGETQIGHRIKWTLIKNSYGPKSRTAISHLRYGVGPDNIADIIGIAVELNIIEKGGAGWHTMPDGSKQQGSEGVYKYLEENSATYEDIDKQVKALLT